ncbi:MAG: hypothetical protein WAW96_15455 [Alphaproteobacteria bacterium]
MDVSLSLNAYIAKKRAIIDEIEDIDEETLLDTLEGINDRNRTNTNPASSLLKE